MIICFAFYAEQCVRVETIFGTIATTTLIMYNLKLRVRAGAYYALCSCIITRVWSEVGQDSVFPYCTLS